MKKVKIYLFTALLLASGIALVIYSGDKDEIQTSENASIVESTVATPPVPPTPPTPPVPPEAPKVSSGV
jgi:hypothetical protein